MNVPDYQAPKGEGAESELSDNADSKTVERQRQAKPSTRTSPVSTKI